MLYLTLKAVHIISMVAWFAGLFYLPRLFVYHCDAEEGADETGCRRFELMEKRLLWVITTPAGVLMFGTGFAMLALNPDLLRYAWMWAVLLLSCVALGLHLYCIRCVALFRQGRNPHRSRTWRLLNEIPTAVLIVVVLLFVFRPGV